MRVVRPDLVLTLLAVTAAYAGEPASVPARTVRNTAELLTALDDVHAPATVRLLAGDYPVLQPLLVPDGVVIEGAGTMATRDGRAEGFADGPTSVIRAAASFEGDLVTLGNGSALRGLLILDQMPDRGAPLRLGNAVAVVSRSAQDRMSARIEHCEVVTGGSSGVSPRGPVGHAVVVLTRSPALGTAGDPHSGASVALQVEDSVVRAQDVAFFVLNFTADSEIDVVLSRNLVSAALIAAAGTSRPQLVSGSRVRVRSIGNRFHPSPGGMAEFGWMLFGGSSPHLQAPDTPGPRNNVLRMESSGDRIEGFRIGILAAGARRRIEGSGPLYDNRAELDLSDLAIAAPDRDALGVALHGAISGTGLVDDPGFPAGERNQLTVRMTSVRFEGPPGLNRYSANFGDSSDDASAGTNRLVIAGSVDRFRIENPGLPSPPAHDFESAAR